MTASQWDVMHIPSLDGKIVVITGANAGLGFTTALEIAAKSAHVILACRSAERATAALKDIQEKTGNDRVEVMKLDVGSMDSILEFVAAFRARFDRLDVLINNAGVMYPEQRETVDGFEVHFGVNHLGHFYLTSLLFDLLKASPEARIVTVSSVNHRIASADFATAGFVNTRPGWIYMNDYSISKLANLLFTFELDRRLRASGITNVKAVACHPGITMTNIIPHAIQAGSLPEWVQKGMQKAFSIIPIFQSVEYGALPTLFAATAESVESGEFYGPDSWTTCWGQPAKETPAAASRSVENARVLWDRSEELLECRFHTKRPSEETEIHFVATMSTSWEAEHMPSLAGKIVIVTGSDSGVGLATATAMATKQAHVVLACPSSTSGRKAVEDIQEKTANDKVEFIKLDLGCLATIRKFVKKFRQQFDRVDILVNNAGVLNPTEQHTKDGFESHFGINYLGHFYLTSLLFDLLKRSDAARVVNLSSMIHRMASPNFETAGILPDDSNWSVMPEYSSSKLACLMFAYELHRRVQAAGITNIKVLAAHPGVAMTKMSTNAVYVHYLPTIAQSWISKFFSITPVFQSPEMAALPSLYAATCENAQSGEFYGPDGWGACWGHPTLEQSSAASHSRRNAKKLWTRSEELLKSPFHVK
ncbi:hypothetical protein Poli38472_005416 [Pythium oligandrum]|uniref:Uncharacterized protein n=1 Tax=Pythium oligandrum TaxID=41045 RepID=A0A8K1CHX9_PYTOL|nr:hypothetical protein Poli38472_005416 [Pythium oligandrum]|eukprot:TMW62798.1 hypothetical protein Poli38472_005416 [Pythium oligandrum]